MTNPARPPRRSRTPRFSGLIALLAVISVALGSLPQASRAAVDDKLAQTYRDLAASVDSKALADTIRTLSTNGSRVVGYPGERKAADYVEQQFNELFPGQVKTETFEATVPIDRGASLQAGGKNYKLYSVWPNLVRTSQLPPEGLTGPLIYAGNGQLSAFNGKTVDGGVVLADFNSGSDWMNAPRLGAKAVIFIEPDRTLRGEAEAKFLSIP